MMKKHTLMLAASAFLSILACKKETTVKTAGTDSAETVIQTDKFALDSARIDGTKVELKKAADTTGKVLKKAALELKEGAKELTGEAAAAVEKGARNVQKEMNE